MARNGIIIGGGASGLMAAITAAQQGAKVTIIDHMPKVGKKILSTGNGKCNLTNMFMDETCFRCQEKNFPMEVINRFKPKDAIKFFRKLGVLTFEKNGYVYPYSEQARTVLDALTDKAQELSVNIKTETQVKSIEKSKKGFTVLTSSGSFSSDFLILSTGSAAAKSTGSDGSGYELAKSLGHGIINPVPALVQLKCKGDYFPSVAGVRVTANVSIYADNKFLASDLGELQLTNYGISGIPVFQVSRYASFAIEQKKHVAAKIDFFPDMNNSEFFALLMEQKRILSGRNAGGFLTGIFNKKLADLFIKKAEIKPTLPIKELSKAKISALCNIIKSFEVEVTAANSFDQAQVCAGGVKTKEVSSSTMESKIVKDLYLTGELLDVDGICGGYNLQWAWASGYLAGISAAERGNKL